MRCNVSELKQIVLDAERYMKTGSPPFLDVVDAEEFYCIPSHVIEVVRARACDTTGIRDTALLRQRLYEWITVQHLLGEPLSPRTISLNFAPAAKRCGAKLNDDLLLTLASDQRIRMLVRPHGKVWTNLQLLMWQKSLPENQNSLDLQDRLVDAAL